FLPPGGERWYAFTYGCLRCISLDSETDFSPGSAQSDWLIGELSSPEFAAASWRIVFFHTPPFTATVNHRDDAAAKAYLVPLFSPSGVDLVIGGHSHAYERFEHEGIPYIVSAGGGAPLYRLAEDTEAPIRIAGLKAEHYCVIDIDVPG